MRMIRIAAFLFAALLTAGHAAAAAAPPGRTFTAAEGETAEFVIPISDVSESGHGHDLIYTANVVCVKHYVFDAPPKCLECRYKLYVCSVCGAKFLGYISSKRVACHAGKSVKDWEIYDNYLYYDNADGRKTAGFVTDRVTLKLQPLVTGAPDKDTFPRISDKIGIIDYDPGTVTAVLTFPDGEGTEYSKADVDRYVSYLKYLESVPCTVSLTPGEGVAAPDGAADTEESRDGETTDGAEDGTEDAKGSPTDVTDAGNEKEDSSAAEPVNGNAPGAPGAEERTDGGKNTPHNPPTGDSAVAAISIAALSAVSAAALTARLRRRRSAGTEDFGNGR